MGKQIWSNPLVIGAADGPTLTAAAAASCLPTSSVFTLPNNFFDYPGKALRLWASGRISCAVTTPGTARYDVRLGASAIIAFDTQAMNLNIVAKTNVNWILDVLLTCRTVGSGTTATILGQGTWTSEAGVGAPLPTAGGSPPFTVPYNTAPVVGAGFDSTSALKVDLFFTQTVATGSMTLHEYLLEEIG
jgi:hypothetical protein